jgi:dihydroorotase
VLAPLRRRLPELRIVLEHITTEEAAQYVAASGANLAATITAHHLVINRNAIFAGGIRPHLYCLPIAKREKHRLALRRAATSGDPGFFLGTDSAPHARPTKETDCGCAGIFTAPCALEIYAEVFEEEGALARLEAFASLNGPQFYRLPPNKIRVTLRREPFPVPERIGAGESAVVPFRGGETLRWRLAA